jgi:signal transduction histidine kinase
MPRDGHIRAKLSRIVYVSALAPLVVAAFAIVALALEGQVIGIAAVAVIAVALSLAVFVAGKSRVDALRQRFDQATSVANEVATVRLPAALEAARDGRPVPESTPLPTDNRDELGELVSVLDRAQRTAVTLAAEQARIRRQASDMFIDLGRRHQALLGRTLALVGELESSERDPSTVTDLLRLDHLVTRMRRNAESLLVLAGSEPGRGSSQACAFDEVVRNALGEIEAFDRVDVGVLEPDRVIGRAVGAVSHLLAELLENATVFSPPDSRVTINGVHRPDGYVLSIIDIGLGMKPDELAEANQRLTQLHSVEFTPPRRLGLAVVAELARRHGMVVQLQPTEGSGITANVLLAPSLLAGVGNGAAGAVVATTVPKFTPQPANPPIPPAAPIEVPTVAAPVASAGDDALPRRIPGEHIPNLAPPRDDSESVHRPAAPDVALQLSGFQDGVQRARTEVPPADATAASTEDDVDVDVDVDLVAEAAAEDAGAAVPDGERTEGGLERRRAGAQLPDTGPARDSSTSTPSRNPDDVRNALTSFQHGVARGTLERPDPLNGDES